MKFYWMWQEHGLKMSRGGIKNETTMKSQKRNMCLGKNKKFVWEEKMI